MVSRDFKRPTGALIGGEYKPSWLDVSSKTYVLDLGTRGYRLSIFTIAHRVLYEADALRLQTGARATSTTDIQAGYRTTTKRKLVTKLEGGLLRPWFLFAAVPLTIPAAI